MTTNIAAHDALTGALSRALLQQLLESAIADARNRGSALTLCMIDIDHFKTINDAFGHARGDNTLVEFVARMRPFTGESDRLIRYGGDEFVLILSNTDEAQAVAGAERLLAAIRETAFPGDPPLTLSLSIGLATLDESIAHAQDLFSRADQRLYEAKRRGRGRVIADDASEMGRLHFDDAASRLIERDEALRTLRVFLGDLRRARRGVLTVSGPTGSGRSQMLREAARTAEMLGYGVLALPTRPALRGRVFGALSESPNEWQDLATIAHSGPDAVFPVAKRILLHQGKSALLVLVDDLEHLDRATLALLRQLLETAEPTPLALIVATGERAAEHPGIAAPLVSAIELEPFTPAGVEVWLRGVLSWQPPSALSAWLHLQSKGLPAALRRLITYLVDRRLLVPARGGWSLLADPATLTVAPEIVRLPAPGSTLPEMAGAFVGRRRELRDVQSLLRRERLVTLVGPGGIGKTRLALQAAAEMHDRFQHGSVFVGLAAVDAVEHVPDALASALQVTPTGGESTIQAVLQAIAGRQMLLVLDNLEHLPDVAGTMTDMLAAAPQVRLLATSREPLRIAAEATLLLHGLDVPAGDDAPATLARSAAVQLFWQRVQDGSDSETPVREDLLAAARICRQVEGLPLGIEMAAAWVPMLGCGAIADALAASLDLLSATPEVGAQSPHSARAVIGYFWHTLSGDEQRVLRHLAVFRGSFTGEAARQIAGASLFFLSALVDRAFIARQEADRYHMHELLRQYGAEQLTARGDEGTAVRDRHGTYYLALAEEAERRLRGAKGSHWLDRMEAEHDNFRAALAWLGGRPATAVAAVRLATALGAFWIVRGHIAEGREWLARTGAAMTAADPTLVARWHAASGRLDAERSAFAEATAHLEASLAIRERLGDRTAIAETLFHLGYVAFEQADHERARALYDRCLAIRRDLEDLRAVAETLYRLSILLNRRGENDRAVTVLEERLALARAMGDTDALGDTLNSLAIVACDRGDYERAFPLYDEALAIRRALGHKRAAGQTLNNMAIAASYLGNDERSKALSEQALAIFREIGYARGAVAAVAQLGRLAQRAGENERALAQYRQALATARAIGEQGFLLAYLIERLAALSTTQGRFEWAARMFGAAARIRQVTGSPLPQAERAAHVREIARARDALSGAEYDAAWREGWEWTREQAVAHALDEPLPQ